jgi:hypothetical protein
MKGNFATYLIRSLLSENRIAYETVEKTKDGLRTRRIEREGPTGLITTTTAVGLHPENETRLLSLPVADTPAQTKAIMQMQASRQGCATHLDLEPWHALQVAIGGPRVGIPFARKLAELIPPVAVRLRRDFPTILALIEAHALLHQVTRQRTADGAVIATMNDYAAVRQIVADLVSHGVGATVPRSMKETVEAIEELGARENGVSVSDLAKKLKLDKSSASRRANDALAKGFLKNLEDKKGRPARLVLGDPLPDEVEVLPRPERLAAECCTVAVLPEGHNGIPSLVAQENALPDEKVAGEEMAEWTLE